MHRPAMTEVGLFLLGAALCGWTVDLLRGGSGEVDESPGGSFYPWVVDQICSHAFWLELIPY